MGRVTLNRIVCPIQSGHWFLKSYAWNFATCHFRSSADRSIKQSVDRSINQARISGFWGEIATWSVWLELWPASAEVLVCPDADP
jgi:hypothetical protein